MATKTLRPLKRGDKCWIRVKRDGKPVLAVYENPTYTRFMLHAVRVEGELFIACPFLSEHDAWEAIFVAKPIPEDAP